MGAATPSPFTKEQKRQFDSNYPPTIDKDFLVFRRVFTSRKKTGERGRQHEAAWPRYPPGSSSSSMHFSLSTPFSKVGPRLLLIIMKSMTMMDGPQLGALETDPWFDDNTQIGIYFYIWSYHPALAWIPSDSDPMVDNLVAHTLSPCLNQRFTLSVVGDQK